MPTPLPISSPTVDGRTNSDSAVPNGFRPAAEIRRHWAVYAAIVVGLAVWCAVDVAPRARIIPGKLHLHMTDFTVYTEAAQAMFDGRDPYQTTNVRGWPYIYPPLFALLVAPLAGLSEPLQAAAFFVICIGFAYGSYCEIRWLLDFVRRTEDGDGKSERLTLMFAAAAALLPAMNCLQRGQAGLFLLYPLLVGIRLALIGGGRWRWSAAGVLLALPAVAKLTPTLPVAMFVLMLVIQSIRRADLRGRSVAVLTGTIAGALVFTLLLPAALVGWQRNLTYLETFYQEVVTKVNDVRTTDFGGNVSSRRNQSLSNAAFRFGNWTAARIGRGPDDLLADAPGTPMPMDHALVQRTLLVIRIVAVGALLAACVLAARCRDPLALLAAFGLALVATLVVSPVARGHYFLLWLPGALFVPLWLKRSRGASALHYAWCPAALCIAHYTALDFTGRVGLLGLGMTVWYFASAVQLARTCYEARRLNDGDVADSRARFIGATLNLAAAAAAPLAQSSVRRRRAAA